VRFSLLSSREDIKRRTAGLLHAQPLQCYEGLQHTGAPKGAKPKPNKRRARRARVAAFFIEKHRQHDTVCAIVIFLSFEGGCDRSVSSGLLMLLLLLALR